MLSATNHILILPFQFGFFFSFSCMIIVSRFSKLCLIKVARVASFSYSWSYRNGFQPSPFSMMLAVDLSCIYDKYLICWGMFLPYPLCWEFLIINCFNHSFLNQIDVKFCQEHFLHLLRWSYDSYTSFAHVLMGYITLTDLLILNHPCVPGINLTWYECIILLMHCSIC